MTPERKEEKLQAKINHLRLGISYVKPPHTRLAIDVGAHHGHWSKHMAKVFRNVIAFEPLESNQDIWLETMKGIRDVALINAAAGDEKTRVRLVGERHCCHYCVKDPVGEVLMVRIDDYRIPDVDFLKIDAEGADALVIMGAEKTILRYKPVVMVESIPEFEARSGIKPGAPLLILKSFGYRQVAQIDEDYIFAFPDKDQRK